jgi:hypothetical protein
VYSSRWKTVHFGLAKGEKLLGVEVSWPSGIVDNLGSPPVGSYLQVIEGEGLVAGGSR